jgi:glycosyltransferase involved in cell wall biosynthesis
VSYVNWSKPVDGDDTDFGPQVSLVHRDADPVFGLNVFRFVVMLAWFARQTLFRRAAVIHMHDLHLLPLVLPLKLLTRSKVVFDVHEHYCTLPGAIGWYARLWYRLAMPFVDGLVAVSESTRPRSRLSAVIVPNYQRGEDIEEARSAAGEHGDSVDIVYFGSLDTHDRDVEMMLAVARSVLERSAHTTFKLGGRLFGPDAADKRRVIDELSAEFPARFRWFGQVPRYVVIRETANADVGLWLLKPCANIQGASPNKIFEYLVAGLGVVASDGFEVADQVRGAGAGLLFEPGEKVDLVATEVAALVEDRDRLDAMKAASRQLGKQFGWEAVAIRYIELYRELGIAVTEENLTADER